MWRSVGCALLLAVPALARAAAGDLDLGFGAGGTVVSDVAVNLVGGLGLQPDGRIVVAAARPGPNDGTDLILLRYGHDGTPDAGFGNGGTVIEPANIYFRPALLVEPDGSLVVGGARCDASRCAGTVRRYDPDGHPDPAFVPVDRFVDAPTYVEVVARAADGGLVVGGNAGHAPGFVVWLAHYVADDSEDPAFGSGGVAAKFVSTHGASLGSLIVEPDGHLVAGLTGGSIEGVFSSLVRFGSSGVEDGGVPTPFGYPFLALAPDGALLVAGTFQSPDHPAASIRVARYDGGLQADPSFRQGGTVDGPAGVSGNVVVDPEGRPVVAATLGAPEAYRFGVVRWTADGTQDASFGADGVALAFPDRPGAAQRVLRQSDGKLVAAGVLDGGGSGPVALARLVGDGESDTRTVTTATTTTSIQACAADAVCDDTEPCTADRCDGGRCVHDPLSGVAAVACLCASPVPGCATAAVVRRIERACALVARAEDAGTSRARRLLRRAMHVFRRVSGAEAGRCKELARRADELRRRARSAAGRDA